jgi:hypothetical protein
MASHGPHRPWSEPSPIRTDRTEPHDPHRVDGAMDGSPATLRTGDLVGDDLRAAVRDHGPGDRVGKSLDARPRERRPSPARSSSTSPGTPLRAYETPTGCSSAKRAASSRHHLSPDTKDDRYDHRDALIERRFVVEVTTRDRTVGPTEVRAVWSNEHVIPGESLISRADFAEVLGPGPGARSGSDPAGPLP